MTVGHDQRLTRCSGFLISLLAIGAWFSSSACAESHDVNGVKAFGLIDIDGTFTAGYSFDEQERDLDSPNSQFESRATWQEELALMTHSFVYHPGFLNIDLGGGPLLVQQQFDSNAGENSNNETLVNFLARLNFLDLKNYPFSLYYQRSHPSITTSLTGRFLTEQNEHGFKGRIDNLWSTTSVRLDLAHRDMEGSGFGSVVDEDNDRGAVTVTTSYRAGDRLILRHEESTRDSSSGSPGLPIQQSRILFTNSELRSRNMFGADRQVVVNQFVKLLHQETQADNASEFRTLSYTGNLRWAHTDTTRSSFRYRLNDTTRAGAGSTTQLFDLNMLRELRDDLSLNFGVDHEIDEQQGFDRNRTGVRGSFSLSREIGSGSVGLSGSLRYDQVEQVSTVDTISVFDEPLVLNGTTPVELANEFVVPGSVVVSNAAQTQIFVEGLDYRLVTIGSRTSVQRLISGNIFDGATVLVDYQYSTSGTADFDTSTAVLSARANFLEYFDGYLNFNLRDTTVRDGQLTIPVNDLDGIELGLGVNYPMRNGWTIGGQLRHQEQNEEISPFVRDSVDINLVANLRQSVKLRLSGGLLETDQKESIEDVRQVTYRVGLNARVWRTVLVNFETAYIEDTGGSLPREQLQYRLNLQWAYRQVRLVIRGEISDHTLGETERRYTHVTAQLTRSF